MRRVKADGMENFERNRAEQEFETVLISIIKQVGHVRELIP